MMSKVTQLGWIAFGYTIVIAAVLYPALHEGFGGRIIIWNCVPPTLGAILLAVSLGKTRRRFIISAAFAIATATVAVFFFVRWFATPLDTDPHSITTKLVFVYAPLFSFVFAAVSAGVAWSLCYVRLSQDRI